MKPIVDQLVQGHDSLLFEIFIINQNICIVYVLRNKFIVKQKVHNIIKKKVQMEFVVREITSHITLLPTGDGTHYNPPPPPSPYEIRVKTPHEK